MRQLIERVTCDRCGQVFDFEKLNDGSRVARIDNLTEWLLSLGWKCQPLIGSSFRGQDFCPICESMAFTEAEKALLKR